jgi:hypothetical protein
MKRSMFALLAATVLASSSGCCCLERLFSWGCCGGSPYGCDSCGSCGYSGGDSCSDCASNGGPAYGRGGAYADGDGYDSGAPRAIASKRPGDGHPFVRKRRNSGGEYEFAAGPPSGGVTYPYYTNRGPRDYLARNPRDIGP